jgi:tetratricopeptide (TPR) repeat protein
VHIPPRIAKIVRDAMANSSSIEQRLHPQVSSYASGSYSLLSDLARLEGVRSVSAVEATIFYSARIFEALAGDAVKLAGLTPSASSFANLETLIEFDFVPTSTIYWANGLRRMGNDVRHILRRAEPQDADLAALFAELWIEWYFCQFRFGPRLKAITSDGQHLVVIRDMALPALVRAIDAEDFNPAAWLPPLWTEGEPPFMRAAILAAGIADILLDRDETEAAFAVLEPALKRFPDDLRLQQLAVFGAKRRGDLDRAAQIATPLLARSGNDEETAGIVAGVYKQLYLDRGRDANILARSHRAYRAGWEGSKGSSAYLGINAAATALWMGRPAESRKLAGEVRKLLQKRIAALNKGGDARMLAASYWDEVTLAEAELLLGELAEARRRYHEAFARSARSKGNIKVAMQQAQRHLPYLGLDVAAEAFFQRESVESDKALWIGVTGHRSLADEAGLKPRIAEAIEQLRKVFKQEGPIFLLTSLAAGADCLVAEVVLEKFGGWLCAVLPFEVGQYAKDFDADQLKRFSALLGEAQQIIFPEAKPASRGGTAPSPAELMEDREAGYERAGIYVVDNSDALLAIWDGQPARGRGGTAEVVGYARKAGCAVVRVASDAPFEILIEVPTPSI